MTLLALRRHGVLAAALALTGVLLPQASAAAASCTTNRAETCVFDESGRYVYVVPAGVHRIRAVVQGAEGGWQPALGLPGMVSRGSTPGGLGGRVDALVAVRPGQRLVVNVGGGAGYGQAGLTTYDPLRAGEAGAGGVNGGGRGGGGLSGLAGGGGGGGGSDIRLTDAIESRILVAGGGGGAGVSGPGGAGGGADGLPGVGPGGGFGGSTSRGGLGGPSFFANYDTPRFEDPDAPPSTCHVGYSFPSAGAEARPGEGGSAEIAGAGGGGGGWFGGGQGAQVVIALDGGCGPTPRVVGVPGGPGGGGSGYADPAWCADVHSAAGVRRGDGLVVITPL